MYCWKFKTNSNPDYNLNDIEICIDKSEVNSVIRDIQSVKEKITLPLKVIPNGNPRHLDIGLEQHSLNFKEEIIEFEFLKIKIDDTLKEIFISENKTTAIIELTKTDLRSLLEAMRESKTFAYIYDNSIDVKRKIIGELGIPCKIIFWAGMDNNIVYC